MEPSARERIHYEDGTYSSRSDSAAYCLEQDSKNVRPNE